MAYRSAGKRIQEDPCRPFVGHSGHGRIATNVNDSGIDDRSGRGHTVCETRLWETILFTRPRGPGCLESSTSPTQSAVEFEQWAEWILHIDRGEDLDVLIDITLLDSPVIDL